MQLPIALVSNEQDLKQFSKNAYDVLSYISSSRLGQKDKLHICGGNTCYHGKGRQFLALFNETNRLLTALGNGDIAGDNLQVKKQQVVIVHK